MTYPVRIKYILLYIEEHAMLPPDTGEEEYKWLKAENLIFPVEYGWLRLSDTAAKLLLQSRMMESVEKHPSEYAH